MIVDFSSYHEKQRALLKQVQGEVLDVYSYANELRNLVEHIREGYVRHDSEMTGNTSADQGKGGSRIRLVLT